ncbi:MAG: threonine synthase [Cyclobacteriaceae bacterium]
MRLFSTKRSVEEVSLKEAVFKGLPDDNGLFMPTEIPTLPDSFFDKIDTLSFQEIAYEVAHTLIGDEIPAEDLKDIITDAVNFDAPLVSVDENIHVLELFHGPSLAFKDFGARFMSRLISYFLQKEKQEINILVATSGDTGSAVAQGFLGMPGINVTILYPSGKVSLNQEKQLTTLGQNITALEIDGVFDDCQKLVKTAFLDKELNEKLSLSSANSINIARLIPQSFYYFYSYAQLVKQGKKVVFCTPSGNFGNLCGGLIAQKMGLPIHHFIASTNANDVVPEYLHTGTFEAKHSVPTISNAMDVGNPSNFPRITELFGNEYKKVTESISGYSFDDEETSLALAEVFLESDYIMCPHTAVGYLGVKAYQQDHKEDVNYVVLATAHPSKFSDVVEPIIGKEPEMPERLKAIINQDKVSIPLSSEFDEFKSFLLA